MELMSAQDAAFLHIEDSNNPMHIGSVAVLEGPPPAYGDLVRLIAAKLPRVPRYRQKVRFALGGLGRPVWVDDPHFQILYHIRRTAVPPPGGRDQLRNLAGRVFAQSLDRGKPLWELWMVEGLEEGRWGLISKVHHCMVDGVSATDLMTLIFDVSREGSAPTVAASWAAEPEPGKLSVTVQGLAHAVATPLRRIGAVPGSLLSLRPSAQLAEAGRLVRSLGEWARPSATSLNGPIGPHRRWSWAEASLDDVKTIRAALGGTVNDVVLASITAGFRTLLQHRGDDSPDQVVRTLVPVSVRDESERGTLNNRVSGLFPGLPVSISDAAARLRAISTQLSGLKESKQAVAGDALVRLAGFAPPMLMALGARLAARVPQRGIQTVTTNVPGPQFPLFVAGRRMIYSYPYVPIAGQVRISIAIFSYCGRLFFGITGDYDSVTDINVLRDGIEDGMRQLLAAASPAPSHTARPRAAQSDRRAPRRAPARRPASRATSPGGTKAGQAASGSAAAGNRARATPGARNGRHRPSG
jgi:WS/DGAT/MGAT family acyltransferase